MRDFTYDALPGRVVFAAGAFDRAGDELARLGVTHLVAGNMGDGAVRVLSSNGIKVIRGAAGKARAAAESLASGKLSDSGALCAGHGEGHECSH